MTKYLSKPMVGILTFNAGVLMLPLSDGVVKSLSDSYPISQILWMRFFFPLGLVLIIGWRAHGSQVFVVAKPKLVVWRSLFFLGASVCFATAIKYVPLADTAALAGGEPVILMAVSFLVLRERVNATRWIAVALGLVAMLLIIRPGFEGFHPASLLAVCVSFMAAGLMFMNRILRGSVPPLVIMLYQLFIALLVWTPVMPFVWVQPVALDIILITMGSLANICGHLMIIRAFDFADASLLSPFIYSSLITHTLLGYLLFGDFPDLLTWIGIVLLVGTGVYVSLRDADLQLVEKGS